MVASSKDLKAPVADEAPMPKAADDPRGALFSRLTQLAMTPGNGLDAAQSASIDISLTDLVGTVSPPLRARVAETIATAPIPLPRLVGALARDEIEVARPILRTSPALDDDTLIDLVTEASPAHRLEIASRPGLGARVTSQIVEQGDLELIEAVAANESAAFTPKSLDRMARLSETRPGLSQPLLSREGLPTLSAHRMFWWVTGPLREHILRHHVVDIRDLRRLLSEAVDQGLIDGTAAGSIDHVLATMMRHTRAPTSDLLTILRRGSLPAFVEALGEGLGTDRETARRIVEDNGGEAVAVACRALDADRGQFTSIFLLLDYLRFGKARPAAHLMKISSIYDRVPHARAAASVVLWTAVTQGDAQDLKIDRS